MYPFSPVPDTENFRGGGERENTAPHLGVSPVGTGRAAADPAENPPVLQVTLTLRAATFGPGPWPSRITPGLLPDGDA